MTALESSSGQSIHRQTGRTFYWATRLLPERIREQTYSLYGFLRVADEVVDGDGAGPPGVQRRRLERIRAEAVGEVDPTTPVLQEFAGVREEAGIPAAEIHYFIDAMLSDVETDRYETYEDVEGYMRGSAAAVGNMMTAIMGASDSAAVRPHAMALGEAFQLTNFIRDVREDYRDLDRVYLPVETLERHGVALSDLAGEEASQGLRAAVQTELQRAEQRYRIGVSGIDRLPRDCQFPVLLASVLYAEHHRSIREQDFDVLASPPSLSRRQKLRCLARTGWHWKRLRDPGAVFERVSPVDIDRTVREPVRLPGELSVPSE